MSDPRQELLRQMAALRKSLDPKVVERLGGRAEVPVQKAKAKHDGGSSQLILDETFQADSVSDVEVPSIAETLESSGIAV